MWCLHLLLKLGCRHERLADRHVHPSLLSSQVLKLLKQIQLQEAGEMEPPPITLPPLEAELDEGDEEEEDGELNEEEGEDSDAGEAAIVLGWLQTADS